MGDRSPRLLSGAVLAALVLLPLANPPPPVRAIAVVAADAGALPIADRSLTEARAATVEITTTIDGTEVGMAGSGAVVDVDRGLVVTNAHVVFGTGEATVRTADGQEVGATLLAEAPCDDLAVLQLDSVPDGLRAFRIDGSIRVAEGEPVIALGYPVGDDDARAAEATPTAGEVLPTLDADRAARIATSGPPLGSMIEHSATLIPGNSGGPLLDANGWMVGINTLAGADGLAGTGFSVPTARVAQLLPELAAGRGVLDVGWSLVPADEPLYAELVTARERSTYAPTVEANPGLWVSAVESGSAAGRRLEPGDYVTSVAGVPVANEFEVCEVLREHGGETVRVDARYLGSAARYDTRPGTAFHVEIPVP